MPTHFSGISGITQDLSGLKLGRMVDGSKKKEVSKKVLRESQVCESLVAARNVRFKEDTEVVRKTGLSACMFVCVALYVSFYSSFHDCLFVQI